MADPAADRSSTGRLVDWLAEHGLLLGPFVYVDYWASVMRMAGGIRQAHVDRGWVDPPLFRAGVHRPDLELPRLRYYLALLLVGPLLLPFRAFRRLGRYTIRHRREVGDELAGRLDPFELEIGESAAGRINVRKDDVVIAEDVIDPRRTAAFSSLFYATYKLPFATVTGILAIGISVPVLWRLDVLDRAIGLWFPLALPVLALVLFLLYRDWATAVLGTVPVLVGWLVVVAVGRTDPNWTLFFGALGLLLALALAADWLFVPRPVPPSLHLYRADGEGRAFDREEDGPYWLEGGSYWVWRYLMLVPAEVNKFWERDWERAELWVRADGPEAGRLEWVVVDLHYRELWIPYDRLGGGERLARQRERCLESVRSDGTGFWLVEVDMNLLFHSPFVRTVTWVPEDEYLPVRSFWHVVSGLFRRGPRDDPSAYLPTLDRIRLERGTGVLSDVPEAIASFAARHILGTPWRYWRYPLGAHRRRERRLYEDAVEREGAPRADRQLQIKDST
ncbi:MAG: hypothetical protein OEU54_05820 [Gemmatimonadota bacterium]|nr:hypothetical protein [Gemmatimonadota bacterium]